MYEMKANDEIKILFNNKEKAIREADKYTALGFLTVVTDKVNYRTIYVNYPLN